MGKDLVPSTTTPSIPVLFEALGLGKVSPSDQFKVEYRDNLLKATVKRKSGETITATKHVSGAGFQQMTSFDPSQMSRDDRNQLIRMMHGKGHTQSELAATFGLSQSMVSRITDDD